MSIFSKHESNCTSFCSCILNYACEIVVSVFADLFEKYICLPEHNFDPQKQIDEILEIMDVLFCLVISISSSERGC